LKRILSSGFTLAVTIGGIIGLAVRRAGEISKGGNPIFAVLLSWGFSVGYISPCSRQLPKCIPPLTPAIMVAISWPVYRALVRSGSNNTIKP